MFDQPGLFAAQTDPVLPEGFKYQRELITPEEERGLVEQLQALPFKEFEFLGFLGKRRVVSFGWRYDFNDRELQKVEDIPAFLFPLRERVATFSGIRVDEYKHVLVNEYAEEAAIGWHKDKAVFGEVVGVSLLAPCRFRFRRQCKGKWQRAAIMAEPRSMYLLAGPARVEWAHSIPPMDRLRYSVTFRNFARRAGTSASTPS
jgi:alkylated DNA repair dioxygenase AlkB